jgi:hypothetical protein
MSNRNDRQPSIAQLEERGTVSGKQIYPEVAGSNPARRTFLIILPMIPMITVSTVAEINIGAGAVVFQQYTRSNGTIRLISTLSPYKRGSAALKAQSSYFCRQDYVVSSVQS